MKKENITIHHKNYNLYTGYQDNENLRIAFNRLTQKVWEFDFESFYQSGFWDGSCILYSLFDGETIIAHTTVSLFTGDIAGQTKKLIQLGTVMTDEPYRNQGLSRFLMERILDDFKGKHDGIFLFANESVLNFYPQFGFNPVSEFEPFQYRTNLTLSEKSDKRKLDLDERKDLELFEKLVENTVSNTIFPAKSKALTFFYCYANPEMGYKDGVYYIEQLDCIVVIEVDNLTLYIHEIFNSQKTDIHQIISAFTDIPFEQVILGFTPEQSGFEYRKRQDDDLYLFVTSELQPIFEQQKLMIPVLSHT